jgi:rhomboid family GlyGly-CTERM serine protease
MLFSVIRSNAIAVMLFFILILLHLLQAKLQPIFEFDRSAIYDGQWWRLLTGHLFHTNTWHLLMNLGGYVLIMLLHGAYYSNRRFLLNLLLGNLLIALALLGWSPDISLYVGLSGWLHALLVCGCCIDIERHWSSGWLILFAVFGKVLWEQWQGASAEVVTLIGADVATDAHLYGAIVGLLLYLTMLFHRTVAFNSATTISKHHN